MSNHQQGKIFWLYGLSGAGKTTLAHRAAEFLSKLGITPLILDGDALRRGVCNDLDFGEKSRSENVRRTAEISILAAQQGHVVITALMTPTQEMQALVKTIAKDHVHFIFIKCDYETCANRDPKGLYQKVNDQLISDFPGKDMRFDINANNDLIIDTKSLNEDAALTVLINFISDITRLPA